MLEDSLKKRIPQARLVETRVGRVALQLLQPDFTRGPLPPEVARAVWESPPYWAFCWPAGAWLSQWLPGRLASPMRVCDLGCGSGVVSIAMALAGHPVLAVDSDAEARLATASNAELNRVHFPIQEGLGDFDEILILADFLYDPANLGMLEALRGCTPHILLADCRLNQAPPGFEQLGVVAQRIIPDLDWGDEFGSVMVAATPELAAWLPSCASPAPDR